MRQHRPTWLFVALVVVVAIIYLRLFNAGFLHWDDDVNISANPYYSVLPWWQLWTKSYFGLYAPVTSTVWALLDWIGGGEAWPFRLANLSLHVVNTLLVWRLVVAALERVRPDRDNSGVAVLAAAVFALHPLQVETVAWLSGLRDLLAACLGLLAVLVYYRRRPHAYLLATFLFVAALLSKPSVAGLPLALVAIAASLDRDTLGRTVKEMSLWAGAVVVVAVATSSVQMGGTDVHVSLAARPLISLDSVGFYLGKLLWPSYLALDYGRTPAWVVANLGHALIAVLAGVAAVVWIGVGYWRKRPSFVAAAACLLILSPVLGLATFAYQRISTVADHYMYLPLAAVVIAGALAWSARDAGHFAGQFTGVAVALALAALSFQRVAVWKNDKALFTDALSRNPRSWVALTNVGSQECNGGQVSTGLALLDSAVSIEPTEPVILGNLASCLYHTGRYADVLQMKSVFRDPDVRAKLDHNDFAAGSLTNYIAAAHFAGGQLGFGWPFLCQAVAVAPFDASFQANKQDVERSFARLGVAPRCPGRVPWEQLALVP